MSKENKNKASEGEARPFEALVSGTSPTPIVVHINELARNCGYFNGDVDVNNGYGCDHPDQDEVECGQGKCYSHSCPLAPECDLKDLKKHDEYYYEEWKDEEWEPFEAGAALVLVRNPNLIEKMRRSSR